MLGGMAGPDHGECEAFLKSERIAAVQSTIAPYNAYCAAPSAIADRMFDRVTWQSGRDASGRQPSGCTDLHEVSPPAGACPAAATSRRGSGGRKVDPAFSASMRGSSKREYWGIPWPSLSSRCGFKPRRREDTDASQGSPPIVLPHAPGVPPRDLSRSGLLQRKGQVECQSGGASGQSR
jgi:hypothetical protein